MRSISFVAVILTSFFAFPQSPVYTYKDLKGGGRIPENINSARTAVFVNVPSVNNGLLEGDWKKFCDQVHASLYKMRIDAVIYINEKDFLSGNSTRAFYESILSLRGVKNLIFVNPESSGIELVCAPYSESSALIKNNQEVYSRTSNSLSRLMLDFARDIKRAEYPMQNFLIPEKPAYLDALPIVEKSNLKIYPGQVRRSKLAVEKFSLLSLPENAGEELVQKINSYNAEVASKNQELQKLLESQPYDIEFIDYMSDEDLLRKRYQFVLRNLYASGESIQAMLKYDNQPSKAGFVSVIPVMPDNTTIKTFPRKALLHKFYIRQNIAKNVYVGEWDADQKWQDALLNYMGNMEQYFNKGN
ncbi:MAG: hypothetical protein RIM99_01945 [Cyclobacteriaceae bacterium]